MGGWVCGLWVGGLVWFGAIWPKVPTPPWGVGSGWVGTERMVRQPLFVQENTIFTERTMVTSGVSTQSADSGVRTEAPPG